MIKATFPPSSDEIACSSSGGRATARIMRSSTRQIRTSPKRKSTSHESGHAGLSPTRVALYLTKTRPQPDSAVCTACLKNKKARCAGLFLWS